MHNHFNGLKTAALFGGIFALLLAIGGYISASTGSAAFIWLFALFGVGMTAYGYWNSDKLAIKAMHAYPVSEAQAPVMEPYVGESNLDHHGLRVVLGQRLTQAASDIFLGWTEGPVSGRHYYVRQLWDVKGQGDVLAMDRQNLSHYGALCAWAMARAHARTGDAVQITSYLGTSSTFDRAVVEFAEAYAATNEQDHAALVEAISSGRVQAQEG